MKQIKFWIGAALLVILIWVGDTHGLGGSSLPAVGRFFCPYTGFWKRAEPVREEDEQLQEKFAGLPAKGRVYFDERQVPHIFAEDVKDAVFIQGYVTAYHRLWQMDMAVRAVSGRLSEVVGERALERDKLQRRKGLVTAAANSLSAWINEPEEYAILQRYADGVNAYIDQLKPCDYPLEFLLLGYEPEPWSPFKSALFFKSMAETLCGKNDDIAATHTRNLLGDQLFDTLFPDRNPYDSPVVPTGTAWGFSPVPVEEPAAEAVRLGARLPYQLEARHPEGVGSNNWAVAGERTDSGHPILCNDPHLALTLPSIWYEVQIHTPAINAYGVSLPGVPGIIIGHNEHIAWGVTNVSHDVLDWHRISWTDSTRSHYLLDGLPKATDWHTDTIYVRGQSKPVLERTPWTVWGPVVYSDENASDKDLAMRWIAHDKPDKKSHYEIGGFLRLMAGKNYDDYQEALKGWDSPAQNFVFASRDGDIAMTVTGKFPLKSHGQGRFVGEGKASANGWAGFIPFEHIPRTRNPERGFVSSANQQSTGPEYPYYYNGYFDDYRGRYINKRLAKLNKATVDDLKALQLDNYTLRAAETLPVMLSLLGNSPSFRDEMARQMYADIKEWDYTFRATSRPAVVFTTWYNHLYRLTYDELYTHPDSNKLVYPENWVTVDLLSKQSAHPVFDNKTTTAVVETAPDLVAAAWDKTTEELGGTYHTESCTWALHQQATVAHLARLPGMGSSTLVTGGFKDAPNAQTRTNGPSWRFVVELSTPVKAWGVYPGGQSGNPGSPHFQTGLQPWVEGRYFDLLFLADEASAQKKALARVWNFE